MPRKRLTYLDMAKGIGIFLVILGHIEYIREDTLKWISSFHMPLFFVIGGILAYEKREEGRPLFSALAARARGTLVPYAAFTIMLLTMNTLEHFLEPGALSGAQLARQYVDAATGYGIHILWFLPAYFTAGAIFLLLERGLRPVSRNLAVLLLAVGAYGVTVIFRLDQYAVTDLPLIGFAGMDLLITLLRGILAMPFLLMGWYLGAFYGRLPRKAFPVLALLLIPGGILALHASVFDLHYLYAEPWHYLTAFLSCAGLTALMRALPAIRPLAWLGRNSLVIMCTHAAFSWYTMYHWECFLSTTGSLCPSPSLTWAWPCWSARRRSRSS